jgi:hypothetical protein
MNKKSLISFIICVIGGLGLGLDLLLFEIICPESNVLPAWNITLLIIFAIISVVGIILSAIFRKFHKSLLIELIAELSIMMISIFAIWFISSSGESRAKNIIITLAAGLIITSFISFISSLIGVKPLSSKKHLDTFNNKTVLKMLISVVITDIVLVIFGIAYDIIYWNNIYKTTTTPGHGVPLYSFLGVLVAIVFTVYMAIIMRFVEKKESLINE